MQLKRELLLIALLLLVIFALVKLVEFFQLNVVEGDASNFVREDLRTKYPTADIEIMSIVSKYNSNGQKYFEVKSKVTKNPSTQCPERSHIFYNYPAQNFVPQTPEVITSNCVVCTVGLCTIAFPEEAVIASHTMKGSDAIQYYLLYNQNAVPTATETPMSWTVVWTSDTAPYSYVVKVLRNGSIVNVTKITKTT